MWSTRQGWMGLALVVVAALVAGATATRTPARIDGVATASGAPEFVAVVAEMAAGSSLAEIEAKVNASIAMAASVGGSIVVFPEFGFIPDGVLGGNKSDVAVFAVQVPSLASLQAGDVNPCADATAGKPAAAAWGFPLLVGSCNAAANNITVVINMVEADGGDIYNTDLVFRPDGSLISKYRKSHVWYKDIFSEPSVPDVVTFNATLPVVDAVTGAPAGAETILFGLFTCLDIAYKDPGDELLALGVRIFPYAASQAVAGPTIVRAWSLIHGATMLFSNLGNEWSGLYHDGGKLSSTRVAVNTASTTDYLVYGNVAVA